MTSIAYVGADADGRIQYQGIVPEAMYELQTPPAGGTLVKGQGAPATHQVVDGAIVDRPASPAVLDGLAIANVPAGAIVTIDGVTYADPVTDGRIDLSFSEAGAHTVSLACWPEQDATFEVTS